MALAEKAKAKINGQNAAYLHIFTGAEMWRLFFQCSSLCWRWRGATGNVAGKWWRDRGEIVAPYAAAPVARLGRSSVDVLAPNGAFSVFAFPVFRVLRAVF